MRRETGKGDGTVHIRSAANERLADCRPQERPSTPVIFANDASRQHLDWILRPDRHPFQPHSGVDPTATAFRIDTQTGPRLQVTKVGLQVAPPGDATEDPVCGSNWSLWRGRTDQRKRRCDCTPTGQNRKHPMSRVACSGSLAEAQLCLTATLEAPAEPGPERVEVKLPGIDPFQDVMLVLQ